MRLLLLSFFLVALNSYGQSITGKWKTIDDETGEEKSVVEIFEKDGKVFGRIVRLFTKPGEEADPLCKECPKDDERYNKKIIGMEIIRDMKAQGSNYSEGTILDPKNGKIYRCRLWTEDNVLKVRGYWGPFYRTQTWKKVN
jgi:uncharacterized protein (DUF2147 family)